MDRDQQIADKFLKCLQADRVVMLGLSGVDDGHSQPMTAQLDTDGESLAGPIWFFSSKETDFVRQLGDGRRAVAHFVAKGHALFASMDGTLVPYQDRATIDRLWNPFIAAWFPGGKDDPTLQLLRMDADHVQVWLNEGGALTAMKLLLGQDPKKEYRGKMADINLPPRTG
jgi:general stress protein 26